MLYEDYDIIIIGGGPAGLAAAIATGRRKTLLVEREERLGGILKQCIHDGFGLLRFGERLSGPEYAHRFITELGKTAVKVKLQTFVSKIERTAEGGFRLLLTNRDGMESVTAKAVILATGCRERTARQAAIHGARPAGVLTAGAAQYYVNIMGQLPGKRCVILGSGDIGLIMARRLTLEGTDVLGVFEAKQTPSGLSRNIVQCLNDFNIPLHVSKTVTRVFGDARVEAVETASVDRDMRPIAGTEETIACDCLILSVGLIPENELAESLGVSLNPATKGPFVDQHSMTMLPGLFSCGNALHVNDLVDYVSESGEEAGKTAAAFVLHPSAYSRSFVDIFPHFFPTADILCVTPQCIDLNHLDEKTALFFRVREERGKTTVSIRREPPAESGADGEEVFRKTYRRLRPPEMEKITLDLRCLQEGEKVTISIL
ncbi:MAG: FAD-dependent oxidoreductase [Treponema sp.]|jgi:thioredoxin reductase|nr:FAD-dependent oxidoreductase [Treponema sp.]